MRRAIWKINIWTGKLFRIFLKYIFDFDKWHVFTLTERNYAIDIIKYCNGRVVKGKIAEIGCGLGDIVGNINYKDKYGFDNDIRVIRAARFLNKISFKRRVKFSVFEFPTSKLIGMFDVIIMVNWIHHIERNQLKNKLEDYFANSLNAMGGLIIDTVKDKDYKYNHDIFFLTKDLPCKVIKIGLYERQREVWVIIK